jgi:ABC-2 type transport system ATP-binding protein
MNIIDFEKVDFSYSKRATLLSDLSLQLQPGHIHGLLGKNGEGKSTLLKLIAGLLFPQKGTIHVMGLHPSKRRPEILREICFLPEELPASALSIRDFEKVYAPFYPNFDAQLFDRFLAEFDISPKDCKMDRMSYGQKKKVIIAFGLAARTKILLMDEPTNGLDIPSKGQFRRMVASSLEDDRCILISTHQVRDLDSLIDSIIVMDDHEIVFNEPIENITRRLVFKESDTPPSPSEASVIYAENTLRGVYRVEENLNGEDSRLDIELLFNAVLADKNRMKNLFTSKS